MSEERKAAATPEELTQKISKGRLKLAAPIQDGDRTYDELRYDFGAMTGWELARAMDVGAGVAGPGAGQALTDTQALCLFAAAAARETEGLDATDIRERLGAMDAVTAIRVAGYFFRGSLLAGSARITSA